MNEIKVLLYIVESAQKNKQVRAMVSLLLQTLRQYASLYGKHIADEYVNEGISDKDIINLLFI